MKDYAVFTPLAFGAVTRNGFSDVSIMTKGEADGHGMIVDETTLEQFLQRSEGKTFAAYLTHDGAIYENGMPADRLGREIGAFSGFYRDGDKVRAKNFQFLDAFIQSEPRAHATLVEMAQKLADKLGISPVVRRFKAWVMGDGTEVVASGKDRPAGARGDLPAMRVMDILSCDFVQRAATNVSLFAKVDESTTNNVQTMSDTILLSKHNEALAAKDGEVVALRQQHTDAIAALETKHATLLAAETAKLTEALALKAKAESEKSDLTAALAAKQKECEDAAKYDMRKAGAPALEVALQTKTNSKLPAPADSDAGRWAQYTALCTEIKEERSDGLPARVTGHQETPEAKVFREKYLARK